MIRIRTLGVAIAAVLAVGAVAASAASAHVFETSALGITLEGKAHGSQVFKFPGVTITCTEDNMSGQPTTWEFTEHFKLAGEYKKCTSTAGTVNSISPFEYEFYAEPGIKSLKETVFLLTEAGLKCTITVPTEGPMTTVEYVDINSNTEIEAKAKLTKLKSSATGAGCHSKYTNNETGELTGNNYIKEQSGTISWK